MSLTKFLLSLAVTVGLLLVSPLSGAASGAVFGRILELQWYEGHTGVLVVQENMTDLGGCGRADHYILDDQHPYFKEIYALLLAAQVSNGPVYIFAADCVQGLSRIQHVRLSTK